MERLTVYEFIQIVEVIFQDYDYDHDFVHNILINNEWDSDEEIEQYLIENRVDPRAVKELLPLRDYFMDFRYNKELDF